MCAWLEGSINTCTAEGDVTDSLDSFDDSPDSASSTPGVTPVLCFSDAVCETACAVWLGGCTATGNRTLDDFMTFV